MTQFNFGAMMSQENQIKQIPVDMLVPYHNHKFTLYQGERLDDRWRLPVLPDSPHESYQG